MKEENLVKKEKGDSRWKNQHLQSSSSEKSCGPGKLPEGLDLGVGSTGQEKHREVGGLERQH